VSIVAFRSILKIFGGGEPSPEEKQQLFGEALLMTLARACSADTNIRSVEVDTVQKILKQETGEDISSAKIRVAADSELFETTPLEKYLAKVGSRLDTHDRVKIAQALARVIKSDVRISSFETDFFNMVAKAMKITPAELVGLVPKD
jgi:uncharacterized tellurite resistance protein B-like protein